MYWDIIFGTLEVPRRNFFFSAGIPCKIVCPITSTVFNIETCCLEIEFSLLRSNFVLNMESKSRKLLFGWNLMQNCLCHNLENNPYSGVIFLIYHKLANGKFMINKKYHFWIWIIFQVMNLLKASSWYIGNITFEYGLFSKLWTDDGCIGSQPLKELLLIPFWV